MPEFRLQYRGSLFPVRSGEVTLGRSGYASIVVNNPLASREHAVVRLVGDHLEVVDLGSRNGTHVNGRRITEPCRLQVGDRVRIGTDVIDVLHLSVREVGSSRIATQPSIHPETAAGFTTETGDPLELAETVLRGCSSPVERHAAAEWAVQLVNEFLSDPRSERMSPPERDRLHRILVVLSEWRLEASPEEWRRSVEARLNRAPKVAGSPPP